MRLLQLDSSGGFSLTREYSDDVPPYAILSHTWGNDADEVTFDDFQKGTYMDKAGFRKIQFCSQQAAKDCLQYFWVDTCCINKSNFTELSTAINSMFNWYRDAAKCYVYLTDISIHSEVEFQHSRWFTRAWTLQELIAPRSVEFFSLEGEPLGDKRSLEPSLRKITGIPFADLREKALSHFTVEERMRWAVNRTAKCKEDEAYSLFGIFDLQIPLIYGEGRENAFVRLEQEISKRSKGINIYGNVHWMVPRATNSLFTGRSDLLSRIQGALHSESMTVAQRQRRFVITGLGGQGKSEICLQIASIMKQQFWGVFWIDVDKPATAEKDFIAAAKLLGHSVGSIPEALQVLAATQQSWLLILDNADDPETDYQTYLPSGPHGAVLITSRVAECRQYSPDAFEALEGLKEEESKHLLLKATEKPQELWPSLDNEAIEVVRLLGSHTLALIQAGAYISQGHCQIHQYPEIYKQKRQRLLKYQPKQARSRYRDVYATFEASADILEHSGESGNDALRLLEILSMLASSMLPLQIFEEAWEFCTRYHWKSSSESPEIHKFTNLHVSKLPGFMDMEDNEWDAFRLTEACSLLVSLSLVTRHDFDGGLGLAMHPLIHAWAKDRQKLELQRESWIVAGCILGFALLNKSAWRILETRLVSHVLSYLDLNVDGVFGLASENLFLPIFVNCGWALLNMRRDLRLSQLLEVMFLQLGQSPDVPSEGYLEIYDLRARSLQDLGKSKEAVALHEEIVNILEITLAETDENLLRLQHELASAYLMNGQVIQAIALLEQVVKIKETTLLEIHPDRLTSQHELASAYLENGQVVQAIALFEQVVKIKETTLLETHPDRLTSQHELARAYLENGQVDQAIALFEQVVKIKETTLPEIHPDRLISQHKLASAYLENGQVVQAIALFEQVVKIEETTLPEIHPDRLTSQHELARAYKTNGQIIQAVTLLEHVVKIEKTTLHDTHPDRQISEELLAYYLTLV